MGGAAAELRSERDEYQVQADVLLSEMVAEHRRVEDGLLARHCELEAVVEDCQRRSEERDMESLCIVCQDLPRSVMSLPCRHRVLCTSCFQQLRQPECPMCRARISS